jgi:uncharacterized protein (TIGR00369 family)
MSDAVTRKVISDDSCFVCGPQNPIGLKTSFSIDREAQTSYARLTLRDDFQGWQDVVHGGILATLLDEACAYACLVQADNCVTAEINVRYRKPVRVGDTVEVFGQLLDSRRKVWKAEAQIKINGALYAEAQAKLFVQLSN